MLGHHHRFIAPIALALALAAATPAAAKHMPDPRPPVIPLGTGASTSPCSEVCSASGYATSVARIDPTAERGATLPHDPQARVIRTDVLVGSGSPGPRSEVVSGGGYTNATPQPSVVRAVAPSDGFDWGAAGIGAGGAVALMLLILGVTVGPTTIRRHASRTTA